MNATIRLTEQEIKEAINEYLIHRGYVISNISLSHDGGYTNSPDPREHGINYSATATLKNATGRNTISTQAYT